MSEYKEAAGSVSGKVLHLVGAIELEARIWIVERRVARDPSAKAF